jgi:hypothetical protein
MRTLKYTHWQDGEFYIGFLNDFPDYETQAESKAGLAENLKSLLLDIDSGEVPYIRFTGELQVGISAGQNQGACL